MRTRQLGTEGPYVSAVGLGCTAFSRLEDDDVPIAVIRSALDHGVTFFDTADVYDDGHNEEILGRALRRHRSEVTLASKVGLVPDPVRADASPLHIETAIDASLYRLGDDVVDLYYLHRVDPRIPLAETWGAMADLVEKGKVRQLGLCEVTVAQAEEADAIHPVAAIQSEFSLWRRDPLETGVVDWCRDHGAAFVPYAPLGRGPLTGAVTASDGPAAPNLLGQVREVAGRYRATPAQVAIAWALAQGEHVIPIPGTRHRRYLQENVGATLLTLEPDDLRALEPLLNR
ncbi:aldo/keto reductase [Cryptosporangium sp. NPDC051539]|uniref:aldo/keto reductase n=1 Tax=Cryptosporangium sp. NPDC051539 TaxID=3363962 RepID=UPI003798D5C2